MKTVVKQLKESASGIALMLVEDDEDARMLQQHIFDAIYNTVYIASNGQEALGVFEEHIDEIGIVVTDITMPKLDGIEMAKQMRKLKSNLHVIIVTAHNDTLHFSRAVDVGIEGYVTKPIKKDQLFDALNKCNQAIQLEKENETYRKHLEALVEEKTREIKRLYQLDALTSLYNYTCFHEDAAKEKRISLALVNIKNFSTLNAIYGFEAGDKILMEFSTLLKDMFKQSYKLYRVSGDEFAVLDEHCSENFESDLHKLQALLHLKMFSYESIEFYIECYFGLVLADEGAIVKAHIALQEAKEIVSAFCIYRKESVYTKQLNENIQWLRTIKQALKKDLIHPFFQPIVSLKTKETLSYECLARMVEDGKVLSPSSFIGPAKLVGLIPKLTSVMMVKSFEVFKTNAFSFSFNVTELDLHGEDLYNLLMLLCSTHRIDTARVVLEFSESINFQNSSFKDQLKKLKDEGFHIALDDVQGHTTNIELLQQLNIDYLKLDGKLVSKLPLSDEVFRRVKTIVQMAHSLGVKVVANHVGSQEIMEQVEALNIDFVQGYLFGMPSASLADESL